MPTHIKIMVSVITLIVGAVFFYLERGAGDIQVATVGGVLSIFMVAAMWIFPEAGDRAKK